MFTPSSPLTLNTRLANVDNLSTHSQQSNLSQRYTEVVATKVKANETGSATTRNIRQMFEEIRSKDSGPYQQQKVDVVKKIEKTSPVTYVAVRE